MRRIRVILEASDPVALSGLHSYLAADGVAVVAHANRDEAQVAVVALDLVGPAAVTALRRTATVTGKPLVLIAEHVNDTDFRAVLDCRIIAVVPRFAATRESVLRTVFTAAEGGGLMPPRLVGVLVDQIAQIRRDPAAEMLEASGLTARELEVLRRITEGRDTAEIAAVLNLSERTVKTIVHGLTNRLNLRNRPHAVAYAMRSGLI